MSRLRTRVARLREESGSAEVFAFMLTIPVLLGLVGIVLMSMSWRDAVRLPTNQVVNSFTQQFAAYGTDSPPEYASFATSGQAATVTGRMTAALSALSTVKSITSAPECGALAPDGTINSAAIVYAGSPVGCQVTVQLSAWPWAVTLPFTDMLFGGQYTVYSTGFSDRGENRNLQ